MPTTWTTEGTTASGWTTASGTVIQTNTVNQNYNDSTPLFFGTDNDFSLGFDATDSRLEFNDVNGTRIASLTTTGLYLDQINFNELSSLPGTATEGRMIYVNNEYYLGVGS